MGPSSRVSGLMGEWICLQEGEIAHDQAQTREKDILS